MIRNKQQTKHNILSAAIYKFSEYSIDSVSTSSIAKEAGISNGTLFFHFSSKEELVFFAIKEIRGQMNKEISVEGPVSLSDRAALFEVWSKFALWCYNNPLSLHLLMQVENTRKWKDGAGFSRMVSPALFEFNEHRHHSSQLKNELIRSLFERSFITTSQLLWEFEKKGGPGSIERKKLRYKKSYFELGFGLFWEGLENMRVSLQGNC